MSYTHLKDGEVDVSMGDDETMGFGAQSDAQQSGQGGSHARSDHDRQRGGMNLSMEGITDVETFLSQKRESSPNLAFLHCIYSSSLLTRYFRVF
jgi:hypothetical protein